MEIETKKEKLVRRVNEIFHDYTTDEYEKITHVEMIHKEKERWSRLGKYFKRNKPLIIADIGSGGGFVPLSISQYLKKSDKLICTDVSRKMLNNLKIKLAKQNFKCRFQFLKFKDKKLPFKNNSIDVVTINSVLHHIADTHFFLKEIDRILKNSGVLIIGHEPNIYYYKNKHLQYSSDIIRMFLAPRDFIKDIAIVFKINDLLEKLFILFNPKRRQIIEKREKLRNKINKILKEENLIKGNLSISEIMGLVDYKTIGFDFKKLNPYKLLHIETYHHLRGVNENSFLIRKYAENIRKKYPFDGRTFLAVYKKVL